MAGRSRSVEFDLLVTGTEKGGAKVERLGDKFDELGRKVERLDGKTARVKGIAKLEKDTDRLGDRVGALGAKVLGATATVVKFASIAGLAAGAVGPLAIGAAAAAVAIGQFAFEASGALAALAPLAAGALFVKATIQSMGEAFLQASKPMVDAWGKSTLAAGRLAVKGLEPLERAFVRLNFPAIAQAQNRIARATNDVVIGFGKWLNSAAGVKVIKTLTADTAATFEKLAPSVRGVVQSFVMMASRVSGVAFKEFGEGAQIALDSLNGFLDRINRDDVTRGFDRIKDAANFVVDGFRKIAEAVKWVDQNRQKILALSDSILALTAVGAALVGGWVVALGASLLLLARHWDKVTAAVRQVKSWFENLSQTAPATVGTISAIRDAVSQVGRAFADVAQKHGPAIRDALERLQDAWTRLQPAITATAAVMGPVISAFVKLSGTVITGAIVALSLLIDYFSRVAQAASQTAANMLDAFASTIAPIAAVAKKLHLPFAKELGNVVTDARNASSRINQSMRNVKTQQAQTEIQRLQARINSLRGKTVKTEADKAAIASAQARIKALQATINATHGKTVTVGVNTIYYKPKGSTSRVGGGGQARAAGGPVTAGRPYVVGEKRPELFVPKQSGRIVPRVPSGWNGGGGGGTTINNFSFPNYVGSKAELTKAIRSTVKTAGGGNVQKAFGRSR